jgi:hypothetical protein
MEKQFLNGHYRKIKEWCGLYNPGQNRNDKRAVVSIELYKKRGTVSPKGVYLNHFDTFYIKI